MMMTMMTTSPLPTNTLPNNKNNNHRGMLLSNHRGMRDEQLKLGLVLED